jgi:hypothetical protein
MDVCEISRGNNDCNYCEFSSEEVEGPQAATIMKVAYRIEENK